MSHGKKTTLRRHAQSGILLGLLAVIMLPLLIVFIGLGIDAVRVKYARVDLDKLASSACNAAVFDLPFQKKAVSDFQTVIQNSLAGSIDPIRYITINSAVLYLPTQPDSNNFPDPYQDRASGIKECSSGPSVPFVPLCAGSPCQADAGSGSTYYATILGTGCNIQFTDASGNPRTSDCKYFWDVCGNDSAVAPNPSYLPPNAPNPPGLWDRSEDAGAAVGCEVTATYNSAISGLMKIAAKIAPVQDLTGTPIRARVVYASTPLPNTDYCPTWSGCGINFYGDTANVPYRPLSIVIAPELATDVNDPDALFTFPSGASPSQNDAIRTGFDPTLDASGTSVAFSAHDVSCTPANCCQSGHCTALTPALVPNGNVDWQNRVAACTNPLILARNSLMSTIMEVVGRTGLYRSTTELLVVNPKSVGPLSGTPNPPVSVMNFDQDPFQRQYQIPYMYFQDSEIFGTGTADTDYWPYPWSPTGLSVTPTEQQYQSDIVSQLRDCFHMYQTAWDDTSSGTWPNLSGTPTSVRRYLAPLVAGYSSNSIIENENFEDPNWLSAGVDHKINTNTPGGPWDQHDAWDATPSNSPDALTAPEVMSVMGSVQHCPYAHDAGSACTKDGTDGVPPGDELSPDFIGLFQYFFPQSALQGNEPYYASYRAPGMFYNSALPTSTTDTNPMGFASGTNPQCSNASDCLHRADNFLSTILIITHKAPSFADAQTINAMLHTNCSRRPIFVVYMPSPADESVDAGAHSGVDSWREALEIDDTPTDCAGLTAERIQQLRWIYYLSPMSPSANWQTSDTPPQRWYNNGHWSTDHYTGGDRTEYIHLWTDMLKDQTSDSDPKHQILAGKIGQTIATGNLMLSGPRY